MADRLDTSTIEPVDTEQLLNGQLTTMGQIVEDMAAVVQSQYNTETVVMEMHKAICDFMGAKCPPDFKGLKFRPTLTVDFQGQLPTAADKARKARAAAAAEARHTDVGGAEDTSAAGDKKGKGAQTKGKNGAAQKPNKRRQQNENAEPPGTKKRQTMLPKVTLKNTNVPLKETSVMALHLEKINKDLKVARQPKAATTTTVKASGRPLVDHTAKLSVDGKGRTLLAMMEGPGACLLYNDTEHYKFDADVLQNVMAKALKLHKYKDPADIDQPQHLRDICQSVVSDLVSSELGQFDDKRPLHLEDAVMTNCDTKTALDHFINAQPEPVRSAMWAANVGLKLTDTPDTTKMFCAISKKVEKYVASLRCNEPPADAKTPLTHADEDSLPLQIDDAANEDGGSDKE